jgi:hypothetical protein
MSFMMTWFPHFSLQVFVWGLTLPILFVGYKTTSFPELIQRGIVGLFFTIFFADALLHSLSLKNVEQSRLHILFYFAGGMFGFDISRLIHRVFGKLQKIKLQMLDVDFLANVIHLIKKTIKK